MLTNSYERVTLLSSLQIHHIQFECDDLEVEAIHKVAVLKNDNCCLFLLSWETQYCNAVSFTFPPVCYYCGLSNKPLLMMDKKALDFLHCCAFAYHAKVRGSLFIVRDLQMCESGSKSFNFHVLYYQFVHNTCAYVHWAVTSFFHFYQGPDSPSINLICPTNKMWNYLVLGELREVA